MKKKHGEAFKFKVALEALSGRPLLEICKEYKIAQSLVYRWRDHLKKYGIKIFGEKKTVSETSWEREREKLYQRIGELSTELDFLKRIVEK